MYRRHRSSLSGGEVIIAAIAAASPGEVIIGPLSSITLKDGEPSIIPDPSNIIFY
ncbi:MAG: hypothetical protein ACJ795_26900 [Ktedonobacteraceae bacterium]